MKKCSKCHSSKPYSDFYKRKTGPRKNEYYEKCKQCMKDRGVLYYHANHDRQLKLALIRRTRARILKRNFINDFKNKPCVDCKKSYPPYVMDFDHKDKTLKLGNIAQMTGRNWSMEKIKFEISKCEIVCANCHRIRTFANGIIHT